MFLSLRSQWKFQNEETLTYHFRISLDATEDGLEGPEAISPMWMRSSGPLQISAQVDHVICMMLKNYTVTNY